MRDAVVGSRDVDIVYQHAEHSMYDDAPSTISTDLRPATRL